ncbi:acetyl-CoA synthetase-like protein [Aspergillus californicus]
MEKLIYEQCRKHPDDTAIISEDQTLTYSTLLAESSNLKSNLCKGRDLPLDEPVGIILGPGVSHIIAQFAVLLAGGTCVPLEPTLPEARITDLLHDVGTKQIIVEENGAYRSTQFEHVYVGDTGDTGGKKTNEDQADSELDLTNRDEKTRRSHILFTSGSTGKPKAVQITAAAIIHLATRTPATPLHRTDRVAEFNNPGFDLSLFEIWAAFLAGSTVVPVPRRIVTDPKRLAGFLHDPMYQVSVMFITAALVGVIVSVSPGTFKGLRHVLSGGDVAQVKAMRGILDAGPPDHLWNTYGPTECVTLATMCEITRGEVDRGRIGIGNAVGDMEVYLADPDDVDLKVIHESGKVGEICIAGPQQTPGYLNEQAKNEKSFVTVDRSKLGQHSNHGRVQLYRTGDLAEWRADGSQLEFVGRIDNQVKQQGFRVHLGEIDKAVVDHEQVKSAVVVQRPPSSPKESPSLVAFIIAEGNRSSVDVDELRRFLAARLPSYMVPAEIETMEEFPMTPNDKVDRRELLSQYMATQEHTQETDGSNPRAGSDDTRSEIKSFWKEILNAPNIEDNADFLALGATSLQAAKLIALVHEKLNVLISMQDLFDNSALPDLLKLIEKAKSSTAAEAPDDSARWTSDMGLVDNIQIIPATRALPDWRADDEGRIFITGVTGFVGAFFLDHLLRNPNVKQIACLARAKGPSTLIQRIQEALERYDIWPSDSKLTDKILPLEGDIAADKLGLGENFHWLSNWASAIFHLGAKVNFTEGYDQHYSANVIGTRNVLELAASGSRRIPLYYMSTIDVWGGPTGYLLGTQMLTEESALEPHVQSIRFDLGYAQSQYTAEGMVRRMRGRGLPIAIFRPGFIIGHSQTGASNPDDFMSRFIAGGIQMGTWPKLIQCLEYVTIDYIVDATMHIASSNKNLGRSYHLLSPDRGISVTVEGTCAIINQAGYGPMESIDYWDWAGQVAQKQRPSGPLAPLMPMIEEKVKGQETRWQLSQYTPKYDSRNTIRAIHDCPDIQYKPLDARMLKGFIDFWNRKGFYCL